MLLVQLDPVTNALAWTLNQYDGLRLLVVVIIINLLGPEIRDQPEFAALQAS